MVHRFPIFFAHTTPVQHHQVPSREIINCQDLPQSCSPNKKGHPRWARDFQRSPTGYKSNIKYRGVPGLSTIRFDVNPPLNPIHFGGESSHPLPSDGLDETVCTPTFRWTVGIGWVIGLGFQG